jgi:hypothetical protein
MARLFLKVYRYLKTYGEPVFGRPHTAAEAIGYGVGWPAMMMEVRSKIDELAKLIKGAAHRRRLENRHELRPSTLSSSGAQVISVDPPVGRFGGRCPRYKMLLYRKFPRNRQRLHLIRGDSHAPETLARVERLLAGNKLDYLFTDGDHTYRGAKRDLEMYLRLVCSGAMIAFHDMAVHIKAKSCEAHRFWNESSNDSTMLNLLSIPTKDWLASMFCLYPGR